MAYQHQELAQGRWFKLSFFEQMANVGSEVGRAINWRAKNSVNSQLAFERALELLDLTLDDSRWKGRRWEIARAREIFLDAVLGGKEYKSSLADLVRYFDQFAYAARLHIEAVQG